jgi:hypothetical protein
MNNQKNFNGYQYRLVVFNASNMYCKEALKENYQVVVATNDTGRSNEIKKKKE